MVQRIRPENYHQEVVAEKKTVLLLCMPRDEEFPEQLEIVEEIARMYAGELKVVLPDEDSVEAFKKAFSMAGTPTFLILREGKEVFRMLGLADLAAARKFVDRVLSEPGSKPLFKRILSLIFMIAGSIGV
jgi:thioredoxin-like negative regulator of GroEL